MVVTDYTWSRLFGATLGPLESNSTLQVDGRKSDLLWGEKNQQSKDLTTQERGIYQCLSL